jgi:SAM-dependent methyltransferase
LLAIAREAIPAGGDVLDVGAGAGAASLPLVPPAARVVAVDERPEMLEAFAGAAADRDVTTTAYEGSWPDIANQVPPSDVVVCSHVAYNVPDLGRFAAALTDHARRRVVVELMARHPWVDIGPMWEHFHGQSRPAGPTAELANDVLREHGITPEMRRWRRPPPPAAIRRDPYYVAFARRRLCLPPEREPEVAALLSRRPAQPRESVVLWWDS